MPDQDMLINAANPEECRIAIVEDGKLEEFYAERTSSDLHVSNIYRGKVTNVEPAIQAAFVDFGEDRSGFLHVSDVHPRYFPGADDDAAERVGYKTPRRDRPPIQACFKRGQRILVQVLKEGIGSKGPTVTTYLSIPGRYLVMMPYMERQGVSRKIEDPEKRAAVRRILDELDPPEGFGFIVRTAGLDQTKTELKRDLAYLLRLWKDIEKKQTKGRGPVELYTESDLIIRTLRDVMTKDVKRVIIDDHMAALRAKDFLRLASPRAGAKVYHYKGHVPMFDAFDVERQIQLIHERRVPLPSGGSLVFDQTEALVAIDVNSGKSRSSGDSETNAFKTNCEAVDEIARQLRLRDLGGLVVLDLIDMYKTRNRAAVEKRFRELLKKDRARTKTVHISELGMMEMTRQRMRPSLRKASYGECPSCGGSGHVLNPESVVLQVMRRLSVLLASDKVAKAQITLHPTSAAMLLNRRRTALVRLEEATGKPTRFVIDANLRPDEFILDPYDAKGSPVDIEKIPLPKAPQLSDEDEIAASDLGTLDDMMEDEIDETSAAATARSESEPSDDAGEDERDGDGEREGGSTAEPAAGEDGPRKKRRRRRRRRRGGGNGEGGNGEAAGEGAPHRERIEPHDEHHDEEHGAAEIDADAERPPIVRSGYEGAEDAEPSERTTDAAATGAGDGPAGDQPRKRRRRRGGRRRRKSGAAGASPAGDSAGEHTDQGDHGDAEAHDAGDEHTAHAEGGASESHDTDAAPSGDQPKRKRRRRRRRRGGGNGEGGAEVADSASGGGPSAGDEPSEGGHA